LFSVTLPILYRFNNSPSLIFPLRKGMAPLIQTTPADASLGLATILLSLTRRSYNANPQLKVFNLGLADDKPDDHNQFAKELVFFFISCCSGGFLCMMFGKSNVWPWTFAAHFILITFLLGCRMNVLRCRKTDIRNPPLLFLATLLVGIFTIGGTMLMEHLLSRGIANACYAGAFFPLLMLIIGKFFVFCYFVEAMHAIRACKGCAGDQCRWHNRFRYDYVWTFFVLVVMVGTLTALIHIGFGVESAQFHLPGICIIREKPALVGHLLAWYSLFTITLMAAFMGLGLCTVGHYPVLNDVGPWQYRCRKFLFAMLPNAFKVHANEEFGADQPVSCPAYLVPINGRTAGRAECSSFTTAFTVLLTLLPTVVNLGLLRGLDKEEESWLFFLMCNIDGKLDARR
jgi:hypothetical protein